MSPSGETAGSTRSARTAAERVARDSYGRLLALLAARTRDIAGAEDALGEAFAAALDRWPQTGVPDNPDAWLLTAARRRQTDAIRRKQVRSAAAAHLKLMADEIESAAATADAIPDRRLALMFACAHPAVERGLRAPLILQTVLGLTASDIAAAFLITPATMGQRLVRAKSRIRDAGVPFAIPDATELPERLAAVLDAVYAAYTKGWNEFGEPGGAALATEAIWLARLLAAMLPGEPETRGMLALMLYTSARNEARRDATGRFVPLEQQDTDQWDREQLREAELLLQAASRDGPTGRYQLEAAVQSAHIARRLTGAATWPAILALYDHLLALTHSPVIALNRAATLAEIDGADAALPLIDEMTADPRMVNYQPLWATRGHLLARAGRRAEAHDALNRAIGLTSDQSVRRYLSETRDALPRD